MGNFLDWKGWPNVHILQVLLICHENKEICVANLIIKYRDLFLLTLTYLGGGPLWPPPCRFFNGASIPLKISHSSFMTFFFQVSRTF